MEYVTALQVKEIIEKYNSIVLYRHIDPDYDAYGSTTGLKHLILDNYPDKKVYLYGIQKLRNPGFVEDMDDVSEEIIEQSLTISLDTSTAARSDDTSFAKGACTLKIDHHLASEECCDYGYVDSKADSASLLVTRIAKEVGWKFTKDSAKFLFAGILTDTCSLTIGSVTAETFAACATLISTGIDIVAINRAVFDVDTKRYNAETYFRNQITFVDDLGYYCSTLQQRKDMNLSEHEPKHFIDILAKVKNVDKYAAFSQLDNGNWTASLRSHGPSVVQIANKYGGGGHRLACGIPEMTEEEKEECIQLLIEAKE